MLTGNKDEDLDTLKTLYNQYGRQVLTENYNVNYEILKNLDIKTLNRFCSTNKKAREICSDKQFWKEKFLKDDLPIFVKSYTNIKDWVKLYILTKQAVEDVKRIFIIKKITNNDIILISGRKSVLYTVFGVKSESKNNGIVKIEKDDKLYKYTIDNEVYDIENKALLQGLAYIQYAILMNLDYSITDQDNIPYLVNDDILQDIINQNVNYYYDHVTDLNNRLVMNNTVSYLEKHPELLTSNWTL
jgi:hypothetical protein